MRNSRAGLPVINIGAATEPEMKEKKARVDDALHATARPSRKASARAAASPSCARLPPIDKLELEGDEDTGAQIVRRAIESPLRQLCANAGEEGSARRQ